MKWPVELVLVRHAQSQYNVLRGMKSSDPLFAAFQAAYEEDYRSDVAKQLAKEVRKKYGLGVNDADTRLTPDGVAMAQATAEVLKKRKMKLPHVVFVSPYLRTMETFGCMKLGWPELGEVKMVPDDRIREQEHGLSLLYNDWRVFHVMHPEQKELRDLMGPYWYQFPQGESVSQVRDRIRSFITTLVREYSGMRVMLVTHHLTILSIRATLERLTPQQFIELDEGEKPINCGVTLYSGDAGAGRDGRLQLKVYNQKLY
jgi:broad specificity phosphatase PhoE